MRILFVCLGNICRSPMAEGIFRAEAEKRNLHVEIDSAGTSAWHVDEAPDPRAVSAAASAGVDISHLRGRQANAADMADFDLVLAMDQDNLHSLKRLAGPRPEKAGRTTACPQGAIVPRFCPSSRGKGSPRSLLRRRGRLRPCPGPAARRRPGPGRSPARALLTSWPRSTNPKRPVPPPNHLAYNPGWPKRGRGPERRA